MFIKNQMNEKNKGIRPPTIPDVHKNMGTPVEVLRIKKTDFKSYIKISGKVQESGTLKTEVSPDTLRNIKLRDNVTITHKDKVYVGEVISFSTSPSLLSGLYPVTAQFKNLPKEMTGTIVVGNIPLISKKNIIAVPRKAISQRDENPFVYLVKDSLLVKSQVEIENSNDEYFVIKSGINEGDLVVISDERYLKPDQKISYKSVIGE